MEPPKSARIWLPSATEIDQSIAPARFRRRNSSRCKRSHTPAACQSASRRCAVAGEHPSSRGRCRHAIPVNRTNTIALKQTRSSTRGRPPRGSGTCSGSKGRNASHSSSRTRHTEEAATRHLPGRGYVTQAGFGAQLQPPPPKTVLRQLLRRYHYATESVAALDVRVCGGGFGEGKRPVDHDAEPPARDPLE
jgi:hypothetical protein